jgi:predicted Rdx family selenoprotein
MNATPVFKILAYVRNRLNLILMLAHILKVTKWTIIVAGITIIFGHWCGVQTGGFWGWAILLIAGMSAGLISGLRQRLDLVETAHWLDQELQDHEAFSAALVCLERGCQGIFDQTMVERAALIADSKRIFHFPYRNIRRQLIRCMAAFSIMVVTMSFGFQISPFRGTGLATVRNQSKIDPVRNNSISNTGKRILPHVMGDAQARIDARALAKSLFPQDTNLANMVEKALNRGDLESVKSLMKHSAVSFEEQVTQNANLTPDQKLKITEKHTEAMRALSQYRPGQSEKGMPNENKDSVPGNRKKDGKSNPSSRKTQKEPNPDPSLGTPNISYDDVQARIKSKKAQSLFTMNPPNGKFDNTSGNKTDQKKMLQSNLDKKGSNGKKAMIAKSKNGNILEFVIPGKNSTIPVTQMISEEKRQREAAMERKGIPGEYQDFMRFYFSELSQKLQTDNPKK